MALSTALLSSIVMGQRSQYLPPVLVLGIEIRELKPKGQEWELVLVDLVSAKVSN